jgi:hypothetical protein
MSNNMTENVFAELAQNNAKPGRGRSIAIDDGSLWNARDCLVFLLETTWEDIGGRLPRIKTPADVRNVLQVWEKDNRRNQHYVTQTLLRPSTVPATAKSLRAMRRRLGNLNEAADRLWKQREACRKSLEIAKQAFSTDLPESDQAKVQDQITRRTAKFETADAEYNKATTERAEAEEHLRDGEAFFARTEFAHFCNSKRYRLTPLHIANALAGLPYIGWRRSAKRCRKQVCPGVNGGAMQVFNTIRRIVRSCKQRSELIEHAERWLRAQRSPNNFGTSELRANWYYLRWSIKTTLEASPLVFSRDLPYAIAREYNRRRYHPSNTDLLFAEEESIQEARN